MKNMDPKVELWCVCTISPKNRILVSKIGKIVLNVDRKIIEEIKWGNLTFVYKGNLAALYTYKTVDYLSFCFFNATKLHDPNERFGGSGKSMRHTKIHSEEILIKNNSNCG